MPTSKFLSIKLSIREELRVATILSWAADHLLELEIETLLTDNNLQHYLMLLDHSYVLGREFLVDPLLSQEGNDG